MNVRDWTVCLIEPNKFERQIIVDLLKNAGVDKVKAFADAEAALDALELYNANIVISAFELQPLDGAAWTRGFRRNGKVVNRKAAVFITSGAFSRAMAEECRHAGCNALIGKPLSAKVLTTTIHKVLTQPREFIDAPGYVGPCRRAGIVTAGAPKKRRKADAAVAATAPVATLQSAVEALAVAASRFAPNVANIQACEAALRQVQAYAVNAGDGPLMRACAVFALQLSSSKSQPLEAARAGVDACASGVVRLAGTPVEQTQERDAVAESVRQAVAKAAMQRAA